MATNQTEHYALNQWALTDSVIMEEFNADNQKLDAALAALSQKIDDAVAQVKATIPRVQTGTYVGTGTCGADNPNTLTFDFTPKIVIISEENRIQNGSVIGRYITRLIAVHGSSICPADGSYAASATINSAFLTWGENSLSWYGESVNTQGNYEGFTYHYIAIG